MLLHEPSVVAAEAISTECSTEAFDLARTKLEKLEPLADIKPAQFEADLQGVSPKIGKLLTACAGNDKERTALADSFLAHTTKAVKTSKRPNPDPVGALSELAAAKKDLLQFLKR